MSATMRAALFAVGLSPGFGVVAAIAGLFLVCSFGLAFVSFRSTEPDFRGSLIAFLGTAGVIVHVLLAIQDPASAVGFLSGTVGASVAVVAASRTIGSRPNSLTAQALGVAGLVWIAGSVTVVGGSAAADWPYVFAGTVGAATLSRAVLVSWSGLVDDDLLAYRRASLALGGAFLLPAIVGVAFGSEVLFVAYLVAVGVLVVCWWLVRAR